MKIVCAALKITKDNHQFTVPAVRHADAYEFLAEVMHISAKECDIIEGFLDSENKFYDRYDAMNVALAYNQVISDTTSTQLYSEDLY